jgi:hypothetical protein
MTRVGSQRHSKKKIIIIWWPCKSTSSQIAMNNCNSAYGTVSRFNAYVYVNKYKKTSSSVVRQQIQLRQE